MKITNDNNKNSIIETDEVHAMYAIPSGLTEKPYGIKFYHKRYSASNSWEFKDVEERDQVFAIIKQKLGVIEINGSDLIL